MPHLLSIYATSAWIIYYSSNSSFKFSVPLSQTAAKVDGNNEIHPPFEYIEYATKKKCHKLLIIWLFNEKKIQEFKIP